MSHNFTRTWWKFSEFYTHQFIDVRSWSNNIWNLWFDFNNSNGARSLTIQYHRFLKQLLNINIIWFQDIPKIFETLTTFEKWKLIFFLLFVPWTRPEKHMKLYKQLFIIIFSDFFFVKNIMYILIKIKYNLFTQTVGKKNKYKI